MSIGARLKQYIDAAGITINQVTVRCGLTPGALNKALRDETKGLHSDTIAAILRGYPDLNAHWLLTGEGEMRNTGHVSIRTHTNASSAADPSTTHGEADGNIVVLSSKVAAGMLRHPDQQELLAAQPRMSLPGPQFRAQGLLAIQVEGDSMEPTIIDGDWLVVSPLNDPLLEIHPGQIYVVVTPDGATAKRLYLDLGGTCIICRSDNSDHKDLRVDGDDCVRLYDVLALVRKRPGDQRHTLSARLLRLEQEVYGRPK